MSNDLSFRNHFFSTLRSLPRSSLVNQTACLICDYDVITREIVCISGVNEIRFINEEFADFGLVTSGGGLCNACRFFNSNDSTIKFA